MRLTRMRRRRGRMTKQAVFAEIVSWVGTFTAALALYVLISAFLFRLISVEGDSMLDTLHTGDRLYVSVLTPRMNGYARGDIVICRYPGRTDYCVKRLIGLPGETLRIERGQVLINGAPLDEPYISHAATYSYPEITLGRDEYFVLGDNRFVSHDSHSSDVGVITDMVGAARAVIWPPARIGALANPLETDNTEGK